MSFRRFPVLFVSLVVLACSSSFAQTTSDNPRFTEVGSKLDQGGSLYVYLDVKEKVRQIFETAKAFILASDDSEASKQVLTIAEQVIDSLGLFAIEDIGISAAQVGENYRLKDYVRIPGERKGLFKVLGGAPHALDMMGQAPENTVLFRGFDFDLSALYELVREVVLKVGGPEALVNVDETLKNVGEPLKADVPAVIRSLSGKWSLFLVLDDATKVPVPGLEPAVLVSRPSLGIVIGTQDDTLYRSLGGLITTPERIETLSNGTEVKIRDIPVSSSDDMALSPRLAFDGKQVILVSHAELLDFSLGRATNKPTLADNADFKRFMADLPQEGNDVVFLSPRLWTTVQTVLKSISPELTGEGPMNPKAIAALVEGTPLATGLVAVRVNDQGGLYVAVSSPSELGLATLLGGGKRAEAALEAIFDNTPEAAEKEKTEKP